MNSYHIPADSEHSEVLGELLQCRKCQRKVLVELGLIGAIHHFGTTVICGDCLEINDEFRKDFPDIAKQIDDWKTS